MFGINSSINDIKTILNDTLKVTKWSYKTIFHITG